MEILVEESNVIRLESPINIIGDVHGQFYDVLKIFKLGMIISMKVENCPTASTCFSETTSIEDITRYKPSCYSPAIKYSILIAYTCLGATTSQGNQACIQTNIQYVWLLRINSKKVWNNLSVENLQWSIRLPATSCCCQSYVFDKKGSYFCLHGGLSPDIHTVEEIEDFDRICEIPTTGAFGDLVWSDP